MNYIKQVKELLEQKFEARRVDSVLSYFLCSVQKFEESDWEGTLAKAGKFVEATIKLLWVFSGKSLPSREKDFKAGLYAQKIIDQINKQILPEDELRIQIPRACIFIYDVASNRGARHDSEEIDPNEMDAITILPVCSWILAELVRLSAKGSINVDEARKIVNSLKERRYPFFEEIEDRIYVSNEKFKSAPECALLILYKLYPRRVKKTALLDLLKRHGFKETALKLERLMSFVDINQEGGILLRATGRRKAEEILEKHRKSEP
jgi:hypothetical protein